MRNMKIRRIIGLFTLLGIAGVALVSLPNAKAADGGSSPTLPSPLCDSLKLPPGQEFAFHAYARGVQIYRWNGTSWVNSPLATLFADAGYRGQVGTHYSGPFWESNSGSKVKAVRRQACTPDPTAIPWLLLEATETSGPGVFSSITYIHRVNTTGGLAPAAPGTTIDESVEVPYTAEYYFYRAAN
jgi:Protein of unknown function (DUF3455)